jgi:hypothetical protein
MADKPWKRAERRIAQYVGGTRVPVTGRQRGDAPDIEHNWLGIELKYRKKLPEWIKDAFSQAKAASKGRQLPVVILCEKGEEAGKAWIMCELSDFRDRWL